MKAIQEIRLDAFVAASQRVRWTLLGIVLLGGLVILQQYLELFGFQRAQFVHAHLRMLTNANPSLMEEFESLRKAKKAGSDLVNGVQWTPEKRRQLGLGAVEPTSPDFGSLALAAYAERLVRVRESQNTLSRLAIESRKLPFLGVEVPGNDFVPVLACMLTGLAVLGWLNVRFMRATLTSYISAACPDNERLRVLKRDLTKVGDQAGEDRVLAEAVEEWKASLGREAEAAKGRHELALELARSHFIFSATGENDWSELLARLAQWAAVGTPAAAIAFALAVDLWLVDDWGNVPLLSVFVRFAVLGLGLALSTVLCLLSVGQAKQIDSLVQA